MLFTHAAMLLFAGVVVMVLLYQGVSSLNSDRPVGKMEWAVYGAFLLGLSIQLWLDVFGMVALFTTE